MVSIDKAVIQFVRNGTMDRGRDEKDVLGKEGGAQLENVYKCFAGFVRKGTVDLTGYNLCDPFFLGI